jgi:hypothetical protein
MLHDATFLKTILPTDCIREYQENVNSVNNFEPGSEDTDAPPDNVTQFPKGVA